MVFISDDLTHDHHGVQHFVEIGIKRLLEESEGNITHVLQFSDGTPTQYKNKINFVNCSFSEEDFGVKTEKHFFASRHGKGPCDREIGVLKKCAKNAVAAGCQDILEPMQFFQYCTENLSLPKGGVDQDHSHTKRQFFYVKKTDVNRNLPERTNVKQLKDTRNYHCIRSVQPYGISVRERSCFCEGCLGEGDPCVNFDITGPWTVVNLKKGVHEEGRRGRGRGVQRGQGRRGRGRGIQQDEERCGRGRGVQRGQGRRGRGYHRNRHSSSSSSSVAYVTSDDDNDEAAYSDDSTEDGDSSKSDDETSLPTGAVAGNEIHVHKDDCVEDSEDDTLKDISGLTAIIAELETDETDRLSPVYSMEYLAILEQTEDSELEVAVNQELQVLQDIAILEQSQEALVTESGEFQTIQGQAILEQSQEALVTESGEFQTIQGPAILEQSQEALVTESGEFQTIQGQAILEQSQEALVTESWEFQAIQGPAILEQSQEALVTESGEFQTIQGPAILEQSQEALVTESGEFQAIQGPAILEQSQEALVTESGEFQTIQGLAILEQSQEALVTESGEFQAIQGPAILEQSQEALVTESGEFQTIQGPAILEQSQEALVTESGEFQTIQGPAILEGQERFKNSPLFSSTIQRKMDYGQS
ncbi:uncharacterized protein LOC134254851 [Saccostrea cucullata]|uniref:uncharacterized protein LOC134254851 n=1 Tax=Saccostrea cuccullata TaxID=36930 RepID=UPI002ED29191